MFAPSATFDAISTRAVSPETRVFSTGTTALAPCGTGAPVMIRTASACPTARSGHAPALTSATTASSVGTAATSSALTAKPSIAERSKGGMSRSARASSRSTRPSASSSATSSIESCGASRRTMASASSRGIIGRFSYALCGMSCRRAARIRARMNISEVAVRPTVAWEDGALVMIDQRRLPTEEVYLRCEDVREVAAAIRDMAIRGAPAIGVAAAFGLALGVERSRARGTALRQEWEEMCALLAATRPTAVNLFWAIARMRACFDASFATDREALGRRLVEEARRVEAEDLAACRRMGDLGAELLPAKARVLTHCNAGALATAGYGTALGVVRSAARQGKLAAVYADETRPFLQGARLTAWELVRDGIPTTLLTDGMAAHLMAHGEINAVVVGADRIAANGDTANKIGTYGVAILAREHGIPFFVAAPVSTIDLATSDGGAIPIEERPADEVTHLAGRRVAPEGVLVRNPAFDVTPHRYLTAIVCERGVARPPFDEALRAFTADTVAAAGRPWR